MTLGTHLAFAAVLYLGGATRFGYRSDRISGALAAIASLLPDVDLPPAKIGRLFWFVAVPLERRFGHRALTDSALMLLAVAVAVLAARRWGSSTRSTTGLWWAATGPQGEGRAAGVVPGGVRWRTTASGAAAPRIGGDADALEAFIGGAGVHTAEPSEPAPIPPEPTAVPEATPASYPWETPGVREDIAQVFNLRLPEPYLLKLKYIAERSPDSMPQFCLSVLLPAIDAKIAALTASTRREPYRRG